MSHADIEDRGLHKNNKKVAVIYEKTVKNQGICPPVAILTRASTYLKRFPRAFCVCKNITSKAYARSDQKFCVQTVGCRFDPAW